MPLYWCMPLIHDTCGDTMLVDGSAEEGHPSRHTWDALGRFREGLDQDSTRVCEGFAQGCAKVRRCRFEDVWFSFCTQNGQWEICMYYKSGGYYIIYIYIHICISICIYRRLGVLVQSGHRFFLFVRAMRSWMCPRDDVASEAGRPKLRKSSTFASSRPRSCPSPVCWSAH